MSKILYFDCFSGISGDMFLAALLDLGFDAAEFEREMQRLPIRDLKIKAVKTERHHIGCLQMEIAFAEQPLRHLEQITNIIASSHFSDWVKHKAMQVITAIGQAEAKVHQMPIDHVHFHEIGAADTIIDVVGAMYLLEQMGKPTIYASALNVGGGFVQTEHGKLPVPAPATLELLGNVPVFSGGQQAELVTPTGAALITNMASHFGVLPAIQVYRTGYGAGSMIIRDVPNLLRVIQGQLLSPFRSEEMLLLESSIDDLNPENYQHVLQVLLELGARDVNLIPCQMKKNRPGTILSVLIDPPLRTTIERAIFQETTTLGIKAIRLERSSLERESKKILLRGQQITIKVSYIDGVIHSMHPEYDECSALAKQTGLPLLQIQQEAFVAAHDQLGRDEARRS
ncbi:nickel pincer cofactor biosynthesis protein LarC [bacterium]|nr:nickel pincer cofactor biosynthesis protein LarC [bacterium]